MLAHLFKLIWNKKKQNFLLILEMFVSFIVMFAVFTLLVYYYHNYHLPMGFEFERVWAINYSSPENVKNNDSLAVFSDAIRNTVKSMHEVEEMTFSSSNLPFSMSENNTTTEYNKIREATNIYSVENTYSVVLGMKLTEGRWFNRGDAGLKEPAVVVNQSLKEKLFGTAGAVGKVIGLDNNKMKIVGVVRDFKDKGDFQAPENGLYRRMDSSDALWNNAILLKVRPDADAAFEGRLYKLLSNVIKNSNIEIEHLSAKRKTRNNITLVPMIILVIVAGFLIINVALGLFGVLWYNINKRRGEIGLRRAVGATGKSVSLQLVGEALVLSTLSLLLGLFFAVQFPLLNVLDLPSGIYLSAMGLATVFIYLLVMICAFYPGRQAAAIYPAVALHEE